MISSKYIFGIWILVFVTFMTLGLPLYGMMIGSMNIENWNPFSLMGESFVYALVIGGVPFVIYHFIIGDKKKK